MFEMRRGLRLTATLLTVAGCAGGADDDATTQVAPTALAEEGAVTGSEAEPAQASAADPGLTWGAPTNPHDDDPDLRCYRLTAYQSVAQRNDKFAVPSIPDYYVWFTIKAPWTGKQYIRSFRNIIDNKAVLHHWLIYRQLGAGQREAVITNTSAAHPDGELLHGWAPGGEDLVFPKKLGMPIEEGSYFQIENHYNNTKGTPQPDASGVELCVTPHAPEQLVATSWLGTDRINGITATGTCTPETKQPINVILATPHMHKTGIHMKVDLARADGAKETIHDAPFDFDYQSAHKYENLIVQPGDKLTTTCTYDKPAHFGTGTNDEMCYFFTMHWPAGTLAQKNFFSQLHGANTCLSM